MKEAKEPPKKKPIPASDLPAKKYESMEEAMDLLRKKNLDHKTTWGTSRRVWARRRKWFKISWPRSCAILARRSACERNRPISKTMLREVDFITHNTKRVL